MVEALGLLLMVVISVSFSSMMLIEIYELYKDREIPNGIRKMFRIGMILIGISTITLIILAIISVV
jgi:hypothetical protein